MGRPRTRVYEPRPVKHCAKCGVVTERPSRRGIAFCFSCSNVLTELSQIATRHVTKQIRLGAMPKAKALCCVDCSKPAHDYDHRDYDKPLDVVPVCRSCNILRGPAIQGRTALTAPRPVAPSADACPTTAG